MKKMLKLFIALVVIGAIAFGVYMVFGRNTNNEEIYAKVQSLKENVIVDGVNIFEETNKTIEQMSSYISQKGYNIPEAKEYLSAYTEALTVYAVVDSQVLKYGLFVNDVNSNPHFEAMNKAYENLVKEYKDGHEYLLETYYKITDESMINKDYIENFCNIFDNALVYLNDFYYSVSRAGSVGFKNITTNTNLNKLNFALYGTMANCYINDYLENGTFSQQVKASLNAQRTKLINGKFDDYAENISEYDNLIVSAEKLNLQELVWAHLTNTIQDYLNSLNQEVKTIAEKYCTLVLN